MASQNPPDASESLSSTTLRGAPVKAGDACDVRDQEAIPVLAHKENGEVKPYPEGRPHDIVSSEPPLKDPTTGALNMASFALAFTATVRNVESSDLAFCYVDVRNFRLINPNYGYIMGNSVLNELARCISLWLSGDLPIGRLGADRFVFLYENKDYELACYKFGEMVRDLNAKTQEMGISLPIELTAGVYYLTSEDRENAEFSKCMDYSSVAHKNSKALNQSNLVRFTEEDLEQARRRVIIEQSIEMAIAEGQIEVWYQPQVDYAYGSVVGAEALARWNHPELGWISPGEFVPVLEKCGKVCMLDLYVWEEACRCASKWRDVSDGKPVPISVNISGTEMLDDEVTKHFVQLREKYNLPAGSLRLEVTESAFVEEANLLFRAIDKMRANNVLVEMDDFGNGLSSLNMLKDVPVDVVKLDMRFMRDAANEKRSGVVLGSIIRMLQGLDTPIIAEGVETLEQAEMLKNLGCHLMQGYHFSEPMPKTEFESFLASSNTEELARRRQRKESSLKDIMSFDAASSFMFNKAVGGMILFYIDGGTSECIMVNDQFYEECGLERNAFAGKRVDPVLQVEESSRETMWRAASEARERGGSMCSAKVALSGRWIDCFMKYIGESACGSVFSMGVMRSTSEQEREKTLTQLADDTEWHLNLLSSIVPNAFVKCELDDDLTIDYISPSIIAASQLSHEEFMRAFHNSFVNMLIPEQRADIVYAALDSGLTGNLIERDIVVIQRGENLAHVKLLARAKTDEDDKKWLYCLLLGMGAMNKPEQAGAPFARDRVIPFDYNLADDRLTIMIPLADGGFREIVRDNWIETFDGLSGIVSESSIAKIAAIIRDLRKHPLSGFTDVKCKIFQGEAMRWYHVNYACDADDKGLTTEIHGYAQDANDKMGSAKWWRKQAEIDYLTGLLNRNALEQEVNTTMRAEGCGLMLMVDLDYFKRVNDVFGHLSGDALLRDVGERIESVFRDRDAVGRYGGDEFIAFAHVNPDKAEAVAEMRAKSIVDAVSSIELPDGSHAGCSVGVAIATNRDATFYDMLEVADQAMYESKTSGKGVFTIKMM